MIDKANCRSRGHSCLRHCSKILSKLRLLAVLRAGMPAAPTICLQPCPEGTRIHQKPTASSEGAQLWDKHHLTISWFRKAGPTILMCQSRSAEPAAHTQSACICGCVTMARRHSLLCLYCKLEKIILLKALSVTHKICTFTRRKRCTLRQGVLCVHNTKITFFPLLLARA